MESQNSNTKILLIDDDVDEFACESEHIARATLNALSASIAILDPEGFILCTNESWRTFAATNGLTDSIGVNYLAACDNAEGMWSEGARIAAAGIRDVIAGQREEFHMEYPCHSSHEKHWFSMRVTRFKDHESVRVVVAYEDITDRKLAEEALEQQRARMQTVLENIPEGVIMSEGRSLEPVLVNRLAEEILGRCVPSEIAGDEPASCIQLYRAGTDELYPGEMDPVLRAISGESTSVDDVEVRRLDGSTVRLEVFGAPVRDAAGHVTATVTIFRDISMRKNTASELRSLSARLLTAQEEERKRIANELHDSIGALLSAIKFSMERTREKMREGKTTPEALDDPIRTVQYAVEEVRRIMADLRPFMIDDLGIIPTISWFCRQFEAIHTNIRVEKHITVEEDDIPEDLKIVVFRIMQEAFHNITKHSRADMVKLSLLKAADSIELVVADNGMGFDVGSVNRSGDGKGGIGLTSMRERAELLGGTFVIESNVGAGTVACASWASGQ